MTSLNGVCFSVVLNGLFSATFNLVPARTLVEGEIISRSPRPVASAAPASETLARNLRRFRYTLCGVISEDGMSAGFLISTTPSLLCEYSKSYAHDPVVTHLD